MYLMFIHADVCCRETIAPSDLNFSTQISDDRGSTLPGQKTTHQFVVRQIRFDSSVTRISISLCDEKTRATRGDQDNQAVS